MNCKKCHSKMEKGQALEDIYTSGIPDFPNQPIDSRGQTMSASGKAKLISVWKCPKCGHSVA
jgi:ribosomal protein L37AE/L43A